MMERMGPTYAMLPAYLQAKNPMAAYPLVLGLLSGTAIGVVRYGNMKKGLVFGVPLGGAAAGVYLAIVSVIPSFIASGGM